MDIQVIKAQILNDFQRGFVKMPGNGYPPKCQYDAVFLNANKSGVKNMKLVSVGEVRDAAKNNSAGIATRDLSYRAICVVTDGTNSTQLNLHLGQLAAIGNDGTFTASIAATWADRLNEEERKTYASTKWFTVNITGQPSEYTEDVINKGLAIVEKFNNVTVVEAAEMN